MEIRALGLVDLPHIVELERVAWPPDVRATDAQLEDRLHTFAAGFLGCFQEGSLVGMASSQIIRFQPSHERRRWADLTADGWIGRTHDPLGNCLHFVSVCAHPRTRGQGVAHRLNVARLECARRHGLESALTDTRLPGLARYLRDHAGSAPEEYVTAVRQGVVAECVVTMYLTLGFEILGLVGQCMRSDAESANYGLAMFRRVSPSA